MEFILFRIRTERKAKKVATQDQQAKINQANKTLENEGLTIYTLIDENQNEIVGTRPKDR